MQTYHYETPPSKNTREPVFNVPFVIVALSAIFVVVHFVRLYLLDENQGFEFLLSSAFIPARLGSGGVIQGYQIPGGAGAEYWSFITYGFLHGDWFHLGLNVMWMLIFGSALARRFGTIRFCLMSFIGSLAGAAAHYWVNPVDLTPMIGASAAVSAQLAAASRFVFVPYGPLGRPRSVHPTAYLQPALSLVGVIRNRQSLSFILIWLGLNLIIGLNPALLGAEGAQIAWQAHLGGFLAGILLFPLFDKPSSAQ